MYFYLVASPILLLRSEKVTEETMLCVHAALEEGRGRVYFFIRAYLKHAFAQFLVRPWTDQVGPKFLHSGSLPDVE